MDGEGRGGGEKQWSAFSLCVYVRERDREKETDRQTDEQPWVPSERETLNPKCKCILIKTYE